jgi:hypothetical protein
MPHVPIWLALLVGSLVIVFGLFRMRLAFRGDDEDQRARARGGLFGMRKRTHFLFGIVYILMGVMLIMGAYGVRPPWAR